MDTQINRLEQDSLMGNKGLPSSNITHRELAMAMQGEYRAMGNNLCMGNNLAMDNNLVMDNNLAMDNNRAMYNNQGMDNIRLKEVLMEHRMHKVVLVSGNLLHEQCLCYSMNYFFSNLSRKYCCDANIVAIKRVHFESNHFDQ